VPETGMAAIRTEFSDQIMCRVSDPQTADLGRETQVSIRPEDVEVYADDPGPQANLVRGAIEHRAYLGNFLYFFVKVGDTTIRVQVPHHLPMDEGQELYMVLNPQKCILLS